MVSQVYAQGKNNKFYSLNICCLCQLYSNKFFLFIFLFFKDIGQVTKSLGGLEDQAQGYAAKNNPQVKLQNGSCRILEP